MNLKASLIRTLLAGLCTLPSVVMATPITSVNQLSGLQTNTITFNDLTGLNDEQFGAVVGQPYSGLGLTLDSTVREGANIASVSGSIAAESSIISFFGFVNQQSLHFSTGQRGVGFYVQDSLATSFSINAFNASNTLLETLTLSASSSASYVGFLRQTADISHIRISAPHSSFNNASSSRTFVDDITFGSAAKVPEPSVLLLSGIGLGFMAGRKISKRDCA